jgi:hypothetical protein
MVPNTTPSGKDSMDDNQPDCPECGGTGEVPHPDQRIYRAGPELESRALGQWPSQSTYGVWSESAWKLCLVERPLRPPPDKWPEIGCDVARFGDDFTAIHVRWGGTSLHHERHNGWDTGTTANQLMHLAREFQAGRHPSVARAFPKGFPQFLLSQVQIKVDDTGVGGGVTDIVMQSNAFSEKGRQYNVIPVSAAGRANNPEQYRNLRSELWFSTADKAKNGIIDLTRLDKDTLKRLHDQFFAPIWKPVGVMRDVEPKAYTKDRLPGIGSPDDADATNLAYWVAPAYGSGIDSVDTSQQHTHTRRR